MKTYRLYTGREPEEIRAASREELTKLMWQTARSREPMMEVYMRNASRACYLYAQTAIRHDTPDHFIEDLQHYGYITEARNGTASDHTPLS